MKSTSAVEFTVAASVLDTSKGSFTYGFGLAGPDTVTEYEHTVLAGSVPLTSMSLEGDAGRTAGGHTANAGFAVTTTVLDLTNPSGTSSVNMTDVRSIGFGFSMVIVSVVVSPVRMVDAKKSLVTNGGATTTV